MTDGIRGYYLGDPVEIVEFDGDGWCNTRDIKKGKLTGRVWKQWANQIMIEPWGKISYG